MAKKNSKPYSKSTKSRTTTPQKKNTNIKSKVENTSKKKNNLENTTRIRIDENRINDAESLDTSFLEGRIQNKVNKDKEKLLKEDSRNYENLETLKKVCYGLGIICVLAFLLLFLVNNHFFLPMNPSNPDKEVVEQDQDNPLDANYLFVGGIHTDKMDIDSFNFLYPYVKQANQDLTVKELISSYREMIYIYNPSVIYLEVGLEDLADEVPSAEVIFDLQSLVTIIHEERPYAKIYVESLYPINSEHDDYPSKYENIGSDDIRMFNQELEKMASSLSIGYIDVYSALEENGILKDEYTEDGITLNEDGYKKLWKVISKNK